MLAIRPPGCERRLIGAIWLGRASCNLSSLLRSILMRAMEATETLEKARSEGWTDEEVVERVKAGETALYEIVMRRYNQRLYRVARAILHDDAEAEDVMQDAYVRAYQHLDQFAGRAPFSAWLTRIAVHEALARLRLRNRSQQLEDTGQDGEFFYDHGRDFAGSRAKCVQG